MNQLVLEYIVDGPQRGYNFTSPTDHFDDAVLKSIWRSAMPRGQGWGDDKYTGARSIKCFALPDGRMAVSEMTVTDLQDEHGRRGIRRAVIDVMTRRVFYHHLQSRLESYPAEIRGDARHQYREVQGKTPRMKRDNPLVVAFPYNETHSWWLMEALVLQLAVMPIRAMRRFQDGAAIPFTTLALDYRGESKIVALPIDRARNADVPVIELS